MCRYPALLLLLLAACGENAGPRSPPSSPPDLRCEISLAPAEPEYWSEVEITVRVRAGRPVLLREVAVAVGDVAPSPFREFGTPFPVLADEEGWRLAGTLFREEIGAAARVAEPDRWEWAGDRDLVPLPHLAAGEEAVFTTWWHATDFEREEVLAVVGYHLVDDLPGMLVLDPDSARTAGPASGGPRARTWVPVRRFSALYRAGTPAPPEAASSVSTAEGRGPVLYPLAVLADGLADRDPRSASAVAKLAVRPPPLTPAQAREKVGIGLGFWTWFPPLGCFVLEDEDHTWLVGPERKRRCPGALVGLFEALERDGTATLELVLDDFGERLREELAALAAGDFETRERRLKGGGFVGLVEVPAARALDLLDLLEGRQLHVEDDRVLPD